MTKNVLSKSLAVILILLSVPLAAQTVEDYNKALIENGVAWKAGSSTYYPSFYTGFAPRVEDPNKIHFHLSRGNQLRLTTPLDENTVLTYLYGMKSREVLFDMAVNEKLIKLEQQNQLGLFKSVLNSPAYSITHLIGQNNSGAVSKEEFYKQSLNLIEKLNPGRIFSIRLNLTNYISRWKTQVEEAQAVGSLADYATKNPEKAITLINDLLPGRVNAFNLTSELKAKLNEVGQAVSSPEAFVTKSVELLQLATQNRYSFKVLRNGQLLPSLYKDGSGQIILEYPELTAIYPNGSVKDYTKDRDGNQIPIIREPGVMNFVARSYHDVDHIRSEPFYGFIPKMDYTDTGNGIHNPAVRTYLKSAIYKNLFQILNIPTNNDTLWVVSRGGVSHGCTRMSAGHVLEVRSIFPSANSNMKKLTYFGNASQDYDVFDINGDGRPEVMGVKYFLAYAIASDSGAGYREGAGMIAQSFDRDKFYAFLYGQNQFRIENGKYIFINPYVSQFIKSKLSDQRGKPFSVRMMGEFELYEQNYEKDKMQFYSMSSSETSSLGGSSDMASSGKQLVRIFGR
ncbi:MAG: hypothetical protein H7061_00175, partial [Bdellovibrionaceae bacterium]|nr:hypothetical protein [Bdellovibrio sp.]